MPEQAEGSEVPYETSIAFKWTNRAFDLLTTGEMTATLVERDGFVTTVIEGPCPRCGHFIADRQLHTALVSAGSGLRGLTDDHVVRDAPYDVIAVDVTCGCGLVHPPAPMDVTGCGTSFRIELVSNGAHSGPLDGLSA